MATEANLQAQFSVSDLTCQQLLSESCRQESRKVLANLAKAGVEDYDVADESHFYPRLAGDCFWGAGHHFSKLSWNFDRHFLHHSWR